MKPDLGAVVIVGLGVMLSGRGDDVLAPAVNRTGM